MKKIISKNPATEETLREFDEFTSEEVQKKIAGASEAYAAWSSETIQARASYMKALAEAFRSEKKKLAELATQEMGKPIAAAEAEVEKCAWAAEYYAEEAEKMLAPRPVASDAKESYVTFEPIGIVLAVMPWNFPYWQVMRFAAPAVMAGNVGLLKHASNVPQCALAIEALFKKAGFPAGVFQALLIGSGKVEEVLRDSRVVAATLTGSGPAGSKVAATAGSLIKKTVLELGGSDPFIILGDADLPSAAKTGAAARLQNNGQSCIAAKRFIVVRSAFENFLDYFKKEYEAQVVGDPLDPKVTIGPVATMDIRDALDAQVKKSVELGAKVEIGGKPRSLAGKGYFYEPTILSGVKPGMPAYDDEIFGPVAAVIVAEDDDDAMRIANDTQFGLGSSLWTADIAKAKRYAQKISAGSVFINGMVKSDPRLPFGGVKQSGYGRELSDYGLREFVNIKTVWIGDGGSPQGAATE